MNFQKCGYKISVNAKQFILLVCPIEMEGEDNIMLTLSSVHERRSIMLHKSWWIVLPPYFLTVVFVGVIFCRKNKMLSRMGRAYNSIEDGGPKQKWSDGLEKFNFVYKEMIVK